MHKITIQEVQEMAPIEADDWRKNYKFIGLVASIEPPISLNAHAVGSYYINGHIGTLGKGDIAGAISGGAAFFDTTLLGGTDTATSIYTTVIVETEEINESIRPVKEVFAFKTQEFLKLLGATATIEL